MRKKLRIVVAVVSVMLGTYVLGRGYVDGACSALVQRTTGHGSQFLLLGCTYWPRTPYEERRDALLHQKYHLSYGVIGGIGPTRYHMQYQIGNNATAWTLLRLRNGARFLENVEDQARAETQNARPAN